MLPFYDSETRKQKVDFLNQYFKRHEAEMPVGSYRIGEEINDMELAFLSAYIEKHSKGLDDVQQSTLAWIMDPSANHPMRSPKEPTAESYKVAHTMAQWLGSNVGMGFVRDVLEDSGYELVKKPEKKKTFLETISTGRLSLKRLR